MTHLSERTWIIIGSSFLVLACIAGCVVIAIAGGQPIPTSQGSHQVTFTPPTTPSTTRKHTSLLVTPVPPVTHTPSSSSATPAPLGTNTPIPPPTAAQHIVSLVSDATGDPINMITIQFNMLYDSQGNPVLPNTAPDITINIGEQLTDSLGQSNVKIHAFEVFKKLYTTNGLTISDARIQINSTCTDNKGNTSICRIGLARLSKASADTFNWPNADFDNSWTAYDEQDLGVFPIS